MNYQVYVPDIVHYVRFGQNSHCFTAKQISSLLSVVENHSPSRIYVHTDDVTSLKSLISKSLPSRLSQYIDVRYYPHPSHVFGLNFSQTYEETHAVDLTKLKILRRYGGVFLDNNVHVTRNLREFLDFEMTIVVRPTPDQELTDHVIIAHRDARFLDSWLKTYHEYDENEPKHVNGGVMKSLLKRDSKYVHILQSDLPDDVAASSTKHYFVVSKDDESRCLS